MALNAISVRVERRNEFFLCMCHRNCFINIILVIINIIVYILVVVMCQNCQVIVTSLGCCWYSGGTHWIVGIPVIFGGRWVRVDGG